MNIENQNDVINYLDFGSAAENNIRARIAAKWLKPGDVDRLDTVEIGNFGDHFDQWNREFLAEYLDKTSQTKLKRACNALRRHNLARKRANTNKMLGIDLVAENANIHGSRAIRRKVAHDARKGTKPGLFGRGSVKLTDADLVERHGRPALAVMSEERFQAALDELWVSGRRLDLKPKTDFQKTVEALSEVMERRVAG